MTEFSQMSEREKSHLNLRADKGGESTAGHKTVGVTRCTAQRTKPILDYRVWLTSEYMTSVTGLQWQIALLMDEDFISMRHFYIPYSYFGYNGKRKEVLRIMKNLKS